MIPSTLYSKISRILFRSARYRIVFLLITLLNCAHSSACRTKTSGEDRRKEFASAALTADELFLSFHNLCVFDSGNSTLTCIPTQNARTGPALRKEIAYPSSIERIDAVEVMAQRGTVCFRRPIAGYRNKQTDCLPIGQSDIHLSGESLSMIGGCMCERNDVDQSVICSSSDIERDVRRLSLPSSLSKLNGFAFGHTDSIAAVCGLTPNRDLHCKSNRGFSDGPISEMSVAGPFTTVDASTLTICALRLSGELLCGSMGKGLRVTAQDVSRFVVSPEIVCVIDDANVLRCPQDEWGGVSETLGLPRAGVKSIAEYRGLLCLLTTQGEVECLDPLTARQRQVKNVRRHPPPGSKF